MWEQNLKIYDHLVSQCPRFERKGKSMPYTSANGHMFSLLNKDGELGIRFGKNKHEAYMASMPTSQFRSHGANMRGYIVIPQSMLEDEERVISLLNESYDYVMTLDPK